MASFIVPSEDQDSHTDDLSVFVTYLGAIVGPGAELEFTVLLIPREVIHVKFARAAYDGGEHKLDLAVVVDHAGEKLIVVEQVITNTETNWDAKEWKRLPHHWAFCAENPPIASTERM